MWNSASSSFIAFYSTFNFIFSYHLSLLFGVHKRKDFKESSSLLIHSFSEPGD